MPTQTKDNATESGAGTKYLIALCGILPAAVGALIIFAWYAHLPAILQLRPDLPPMQFNAALCLVLSGTALCARLWGNSRPAIALGGASAIVASLTLYEYLTGIDLGIDQLFFRTYIMVQVSHAGRMAPASACCLLLAGIGIVLSSLRAQWKWKPVAIGSLGSVVIMICTVAALGYSINLPGTYGWGELTRIAAHTAVCLVLLGTGIFLLAWPGRRKNGDPMPVWLPVPLGLAIFAASLLFYEALESRQNQEVVQAVRTTGESVSSALNTKIEGRIRSLVRMAERWEFSGRPERDVWENDAKNYVKDFPDFQAIEWIDGAHTLRWIEPLEGNEAKIGQDLFGEERRWKAALAARQTRDATLTHVVQLFRGGLGFIIYIPIYKDGQFDGWIAAVFKAQQIFDRFLPGSVVPGYAITISDGEQLYARDAEGAQPTREGWIYTSTMEMRGATWTVRVWPSAPLAARMNSALPELVLLVGTGLAFLLGLSIHLAQNSSAQARRTAALNLELQTALAEVKALSGLLPICAGCKRIRDDGGYWNQIERYISNHSQASFSHGICPECAVKFYESEGMEVPDEVIKDAEKRNYD